MSDKTDVTVNENPENETTEVVATVPTLNLKIAKIATASFTAGAAIATLIMKIRYASNEARGVYLLTETPDADTETQD